MGLPWYQQEAQPIGEIVEVVARTQPLTSTAKPVLNSPPKVPPLIRKIVAEIGFRFRPAAQADLDAHVGWLAALAVDLADVPPSLLERAISRYARHSKFKPTAAELIDFARQIDEEERGPVASFSGDQREWLRELASRYNRAPSSRTDIEWHVTGDGELKLRATHAEQCRRIAAHNARLEANGSAIRIPMPDA